MANKRLTLTDEHLKLISEIQFEGFSFDSESQNGRFGWGIDQWNLFGGTYVLEDVARIVGVYDQHIKGTEEDPQGVDFEDSMKAHLWELYQYIYDNMEYIISLVLYFSNKGGIKPGTYRMSKQNTELWTKED